MRINSTTHCPTAIAVLCGFSIVLATAGCRRPQEYKAQADQTVYHIIDQKWQDDYGNKANYKISDTPPLPDDIQIEKTIPASGVLTLRQAVEIATAHNRQYQLEKEILYISALDLRLARHVFEPQYFGGADTEYVKAGDDEAVSASSFLGFNRLLASGALISTNVTAAWVEILTGDQRSGFRTFLNSTITQPLLRGSGSRIVLENLTQAERDTVYQIRSFNRFRQTFTVSVISQYYLVLQQMDIVKNAESNYHILGDLGTRTEKLVLAGRLPGYELDRVRQEMLDAKDFHIDAQEDYRQALDEFKLLLSLPLTTEFRLDDGELAVLNRTGLTQPDYSMITGAAEDQTDKDLTAEALDMLEAELELMASGGRDETEQIEQKQPAGTFSEAEALETALSLRLDLANREDAVSDARRKIEVAADSLRAELNLTANTSFSSRGSSDHLAAIGAELDLPLDRMAEANAYRVALITLTQRQRDYEEAADTVALEVRRAYGNLAESAERYRVQSESLELAKKRYDNTLRLMYYGRASSRRVLDSQQALFDAQNAVTQAIVNHAIAMLEFYRDTGVLQVLPDGLWQQNTVE